MVIFPQESGSKRNPCKFVVADADLLIFPNGIIPKAEKEIICDRELSPKRKTKIFASVFVAFNGDLKRKMRQYF